MNENKDFIIKLKNIVSESNIKIDEPMKNHTSFKVGGPVDILITPTSYEQVSDLIKLCASYNVNYFIIGNGSNLLVKDGGIKGVVIKLLNLNKIECNDLEISAQAGVSLTSVSMRALRESLTGLEFACGIPGSIGGALAMNAGAYNGEIAQVIKSAIVIDKEGNIKQLDKKQLELGYRTSAILKNDYIVLEATFKLENGDHEKIQNRINDLTRRRKERQPLEYASAGSTFKRPDGYFAAKLIEDSGLKGVHVGDAEVSVKHSGFIINKGKANAKDILDLIKIVQQKVKEQFDVELDTEVRIVGEEKK